MGYHPLPPPPPEAPRVDNSDAILLVVESLEKIASDICGSNRMELEQEIENLRGLARRAAQ